MEFSAEPTPKKSQNIVVHDERPLNAEPPVSVLVDYPITPLELVYARNHGPIQNLDATTFKVKIDGLVQRQQEYTLEDLKKTFVKTEVIASLECAGNRRKAMQDMKNAPVEGILWGEGTICNVKWGGVRIRDLLLSAEVPMQHPSDASMGLHVCFASHVTACEKDDWFGASVPLEKGIVEDGDALLAYEMNDQPLLPEHGYPFRAVIPGHSGARWVKWVDQITVSRKESENYYQQRDYKVLPPEVKTHDKADAEDWWSRVKPLQACSLHSVIADAKCDEAGRKLVVRGYAVCSPATQVDQVKLSIDGGKSWLPAKIRYQEGKWSWTLWDETVELPESGLHGEILSCATDKAGNSQQADTDWNLRGVGYSGYGRAQY